MNHERFRCQRDFSYIIELLPKKYDLHASVRGHTLQQYLLAPPYAVQYALVVSATCAAAARGEQCAQHSAPRPRGSRDDSVTGSARYSGRGASPGHREFVGNAVGGVSQCTVSLSRSVVLLAQDSLSL